MNNAIKTKKVRKIEVENPMELLRKEHGNVLKLLDKLEKGINNKNFELLKGGISVLEKEFDKHSINKEERALFPEIEKFIPRDGGPTGIMVMEHKELVGLIGQFKEALNEKNFEKLRGIGNSIFSVLRPHIDKENNILFMMADMHLDSRQKKAILEKFKRFDSTLKGDT